LKESGDIEYAADIVIFIHLPKKEKLAEAIVAKNRYKPGKLGIIKLVWLEDRVMFGNYDWKNQSDPNKLFGNED
jgi:replicative DNA helicase